MSTCIITGAGSGIGQAVAIELSKKKIFKNLVLIGHSEQSLKETKRSMEQINSEEIVQDLSMLEEIPEVISYIYETYGSINCLLNIAGYTEPAPLLSTSTDNMKHTYAVNVFSVFVMIRECTKFMKQNPEGGKILNVASTAGITPRPGWLSYASSKAAVISMSQTLTEELAEQNISFFLMKFFYNISW